MLTEDIKREVVRGCRILHSLGLVDMLGNLAVRVPGQDAFAIKPGAGQGVPAPHRLQADDVLLVDFGGQVIEGRYRPPKDVQMYCQIFRSRRDVGAIVHTHQEFAAAFASAHRPLKAIGHVEGEMAVEGIPFWGAGELADTLEHGKDLADVLGEGKVVLLPGHGVVCVGALPNLAILNAYNLEVLAQFNIISDGLGGTAGTLTSRECDKLNAQRKNYKSSPDKNWGRFFDSLISADLGKAPDPWPEGPNPEETCKARMELACHILYHFGLVKHLEHVTCRLPDDRFLISPRGNMGLVQAQDMALLDMECHWIGGEFEPPPFKWFHQSILRLRPEVKAIVHTHQMYGRIYPVSGIPLKPVYRVGAWQACIDIPVYGEADLLFEMEAVQEAVKLLGSRPIIHELHHGTDYAAPTLVEATVWAVHNESLARRQNLASSLGTPAELSGKALDKLPEQLPSAEAWWEYYVSLL